MEPPTRQDETDHHQSLCIFVSCVSLSLYIYIHTPTFTLTERERGAHTQAYLFILAPTDTNTGIYQQTDMYCLHACMCIYIYICCYNCCSYLFLLLLLLLLLSLSLFLFSYVLPVQPPCGRFKSHSRRPGDGSSRPGLAGVDRRCELALGDAQGVDQALDPARARADNGSLGPQETTQRQGSYQYPPQIRLWDWHVRSLCL